MLGLTYYRRLRADGIQVYRIINKIDKLELSIYYYFNTRPSRCNSVRLIQLRAITTIIQSSFSHRVVNSWNDLPEDVVLADSLNQFKNKLKFCSNIELSNMKCPLNMIK